MRRPAAAIDPVSPINSKSAALPGPIAIELPSRMRSRGSSRSSIGVGALNHGAVRAQEDGEHRAGAEGALDVEKSAVAVEDVLDDREPEPGPAHFARAGGVDAVEPLGQPWQMLAGDAFALITHSNRYKGGAPGTAAAIGRPSPVRGRYRDLAAGAAVFDRIVEEVLKELGELVAVADRVGQIWRHIQPDMHPALAGAQLQRVGEMMQQWPECHASLRHHMLVELDPRQRQQILDEADHACGLLVHDRKKALARFGILARRPAQ